MHAELREELPVLEVEGIVTFKSELLRDFGSFLPDVFPAEGSGWCDGNASRPRLGPE
jgi:hypothetical protein